MMAGRTARKVFRAEVGANVGVSKVGPLPPKEAASVTSLMGNFVFELI